MYCTALHRSMIVRCRPVLYIDIIQLIIRHLHRLVNVRYKCCDVLSSAGVGLVSKLNVREHHLQNKVIMSSQLQCKMLLRL
jgi:hypothetical protein